MQKTYTIIVNNVSAKITPILHPDLVKALDEELSFVIQGSEYSAKVRNFWWDGKKHLFKKKAQAFATGLLSRVKSVFDKYCVKCEIDDKREEPTLGKPYSFSCTLRDYQNTSVQDMCSYGRGIVQSPTGSGKTVIIGGFISQINVPTLIVVPKRSLLIQTKNHLEEWLNVAVGCIGDGICDPKRITIATMQSLIYAYKGEMGQVKTEERREVIREVLENVDSLIVDESHHLSAPSLQYLEKYAKHAYYRIGVSATPFRDDNDDMLIEMFTGRRIVNLTASDLIKQGWLSKPTIYLYECNHERQSSTLGYEELYDKEICKNVGRNNTIIRLANENVSQNKSVLIAVSRIDHGVLLESELKKYMGDKVIFVNGEFPSDEMYQVLEDLNEKKYMCVIATTVFGEGVDVPSLDTLILAKGGSSRVCTMQLVGRALRKTKTKNTATIIDFWDQGCRFLGKHAELRLSTYKSEPEFEINFVKV